MRPPPTTFELIEAVALREPRRVALVEAGQDWSYAQLYLHVLRFTQALQALGIARGHRVAVSAPHAHAEFFLLLACENLGAVTASFSATGDSFADIQALAALVDWVIGEARPAGLAHARFQLLDEPFIQGAAARDPLAVPGPRVALPLHEPQRVSRTSGSTGRSRFMALSRQAQEHFIRMGGENGGYGPSTRLLAAAPLLVNTVYARSCACLRRGATVVLDGGIQEAAPTHVLALPIRLQELLDGLPPGYRAPHSIDVGAIGGFVSAALRDRVRQLLGGRLVNRYGANEVAGICDDMDENGEGLLAAGVDLRIVDGEGRDLPPGTMGTVVLRTPAMAEGYLGDEEATRAAFKDGWFHTGDLGTLVAPRRLRLAGRHDELLNIGGLKLPAAQLEERIRALTGVQQCAALTIPPQAGGATLGFVLAVAPGSQRDAAARVLQEGLELVQGTAVRLLFLEALPVMPTGKVDRLALQRLFAAQPG